MSEPTPEPTTTGPDDNAPQLPASTPAPTPADTSATPVTPAPAALPHPPTPHAPTPHAPTTGGPSASTSFGRVAEDGTVFVRTPDGEREVGSYPEATHEEALAYFARKYDELAASANLLLQRVIQTDLSTHDASEALKALRKQVSEARVVGDLATLDSTVEQIATAVRAKQQVESEHRAEAKAAALEQREAVVAEAEKIAAQPVEKVQWKQSTGRMRELLEEWKTMQRTGARLDKEVENGLWQRFSSARNGFDKARRQHFARLDEEHAGAKAAKEKLIAEAEKLSGSTDWGQTAGSFKRLMGEWKRAGRAARKDDDALWARFKAAQDSFFGAKDAVTAAENVEFEANLKVKEGLLKQAEALLPVKDPAATKRKLRDIQDQWEAAGKVPRKDMDRMERGMRRVENAVRDAEGATWKRTDPERSARANSMLTQLEQGIKDVEDQIASAQASGDTKRVARLTKDLDARKAWLESVRGSLESFQ